MDCSRQEKMEIHGRQRQSTRHAVKVKGNGGDCKYVFMNWLSTLGRGYSALGDYFDHLVFRRTSYQTYIKNKDLHHYNKDVQLIYLYFLALTIFFFFTICFQSPLGNRSRTHFFQTTSHCHGDGRHTGRHSLSPLLQSQPHATRPLEGGQENHQVGAWKY